MIRRFPPPDMTRIIYRIVFATILALGGVLSTVISGLSAVTLVYFRATGSPAQVDIEWQTASEVDMVGFYVLRSDTLAGIYSDISGLILAQGDALGGATYPFIDHGVTQGQTYYYKLQVLDRNQQSEYFGPVSAYAGTETLTPTPTPTMTTQVSGNTASPTTNSLTPTKTATAANPTRTRTPVPFPTVTLEKLAVTRTSTIAVATLVIPEITETTELTLTYTQPAGSTPIDESITLLPGLTSTSFFNTPVPEPKGDNLVGWLLVGIGGSGLVIGIGWLIWALLRQKK